MGGKFSPIIIIVLLVIVVVMGLLTFSILSGLPSKPTQNSTDIPIEAIAPVLTLDKKVNSDGTVTITATASTDDVDGINSIKLPDGNVVSDSTAEYIAEENKKYEFSVRGNNGQETILEIEVSEIEGPSSTKPYVPEGFDIVSNEIENGFIIADEYGNQYVWVPVPSGRLKRNTDLNVSYSENNASAAALVNSVAKYYGFYIGRFEASEYELDGKKVAASMMGKTPWTDITCEDATEYAANSGKDFGYTDDTHTSIINSYAWDTAVAWIEEQYPEYSSSTQYGNYDGMILPTGMTEKDRLRGICDLSGNVREWTSEVFITKESSSSGNITYKVVRGGGARLSRTPSSHIGYQENTTELYRGFRMILYK